MWQLSALLSQYLLNCCLALLYINPPTLNIDKMSPIAVIHTPFIEKFAIPRQPQLAPAATGRVELIPPFDDPLAFVGLEQVSHVWLLFKFHAVADSKDQAPKLRVRPPRLGGNEKIGVFASRSTHRPNGIGMSVVRLEKVEGTCLYVSGVDLLNGTPILDIKPYVPYADSVTTATNHLAKDAPKLVSVTWQAAALQQAKEQSLRLQTEVIELIEQCLAQDPKPAYQTPSPDRTYGVRFWDLNIRWCYPSADVIQVLAVDRALASTY